jgi:toxin ParE1/3/4
MTTVYFTGRAERDLEDIGDYIAADNPVRALSFIREIRQRCAKIAEAPLAYPARPELGPAIRCCTYGRYVIFFQPADTHILIVRVLHGARELSRIFPPNS